MTQICVFNTRLFSLHNTLNYATHGARLRMVLLTDVYRNLTSLWIKPRERAFKQFKSPILNVLILSTIKKSIQISETDVQEKFHTTEVLSFKSTVRGLHNMSQDNQFLGSDLIPDPPALPTNSVPDPLKTGSENVGIFVLQYSNIWPAVLKIQCYINPYPTAFPYGNGMVLHFYQQQESSTTKTIHKVINKGLKAYV